MRANRFYICLSIATIIALFSSLHASASPVVSVVCPQNVHVGDVFTVDIVIESDEEIYAVEYGLRFDSHLLNVISQHKGDFFENETIIGVNKIDNEGGIVEYAETCIGEHGKKGKGNVSSIKFKAINVGESQLNLTNLKVIGSNFSVLSAEIVNGSCTVTPQTTPSPSQQPSSSASSPSHTPSPSPSSFPSPEASSHTPHPSSSSQTWTPSHMIQTPEHSVYPPPQSSQPSSTPPASPARLPSVGNANGSNGVSGVNGTNGADEADKTDEAEETDGRKIPSAAFLAMLIIVTFFLLKRHRVEKGEQKRGKRKGGASVIFTAFLTVILTSLLLISAATPAEAKPKISVQPSHLNVSAGQTFTVNITIETDEEIYAVGYEIHFDRNVLNAISQCKGDFFENETIIGVNKIDNEGGIVEYAETCIGEHGKKGKGNTSSIKFKALSRNGVSVLNFENVTLLNSSMMRILPEIANGSVKVNAPIGEFVIEGGVFYENGTPCEHPEVRILNMNTSEEWTANASHNHYRCNLKSGDDVIAGEFLQIVAKKGNHINRTLYEVTQSDIDAGHVHLNFSLSPIRHDVRIPTSYAPPSGIKIEKNGEETENITVGDVCYVKYLIENVGNVAENVYVTVKVVNESDEIIINSYNVTIDAGGCDEREDVWDTSMFEPGAYEIVVNASIQCDENIEDNERMRGVILSPSPFDVVVSAVNVNPRCYLVHDLAFRNQENEICASVRNNGEKSAEFNVSFVIDGVLVNKSLVKLNAEDETELCIHWTPTSLGIHELNVTADPDDHLNEMNESNNVVLMNITVCDNGFKGKRYSVGEAGDVKTVRIYEGKLNISYSFGDSYCLKTIIPWNKYTANWSAYDLLPADATVKAARLYLYYDADWTQNGIENYLSLIFNGNQCPFDVVYNDRVVFRNNNNPSGMIAYDVTKFFNASGENNAVIYNNYGGGAVIDGMLLVVIYEREEEPERVICVNEGFDWIRADENYCVNATEATAYAPFECSFSEVKRARLIAIAPQADRDEGRSALCFNDASWHDVFTYPKTSDEAPRLGVCDVDVSAYIKHARNVAMIRSESDDMAASNVILVVDGVLSSFDTGESPDPYPSIPGTFECTLVPFQNITLNTVSVYPCRGTGGHITRIELHNESWNATAEWNGYVGEWNKVKFDKVFTLIKNHTYHLNIVTGSYPQIIHLNAPYITEKLRISCEFTDVNGVVHDNWMPAMRFGVE